MKGDRALNYSAEEIIRLIRTKKDDFWSRERERRPLKLFHEAAQRVPAYKDFLKKNKIQPARIKTFKDFQLVPPVSKQNYLRQYPLEKLCWDGTLANSLVFTATSGSTGEPFYFPRTRKIDWEYSVLAELFLEDSSYGRQGPILVVVCLGMGVWIAGVFSYQAFKLAAERRNLPLSIITPGINKAEVFKALRNLAPLFSQVILLGYPPFLKDILDEAAGEGVHFKKMNVRILTGAEAFTEKFRDYLIRKAAIRNPYLDTLNVYGSADIGTMAYETPTSILVRRLVMRNRKIFEEIFSTIDKTPTLAQYNPFFITFEAPAGEILLTAGNILPFVRYSIGDHGGVRSFKEMKGILAEHGINTQAEARRVGIGRNVYQLPFVYVYERMDFSTTLYGLQIYPEFIREVLLNNPLSKFLTGKFVLLTKYDREQDQYLEIHLELRRGRNGGEFLKKKALQMIIGNLRTRSSEFRELAGYLGKRASPRLTFWRYEHPLHFRPGTKQKWVK